MPSAEPVSLSTGVFGCDGLSESFCDTSAKVPDHTQVLFRVTVVHVLSHLLTIFLLACERPL